ncbi:Glycerol-3-phosphate acyltransferase [Nymphon striatum]|nr:Glycerol-3-phosphate acyltransferase [Nymphon striatum]
MSKSEIVSLVSLAYPFIQKELFLVWDKTQLENTLSTILQQLSNLGMLSYDSENDTYSRPSSNSKENTQLTLLAKVISPVLEVYYLTLALLSKSSKQQESTTINKQKLVDKCILMSQRVAMIHEINSPDYSDKHLIANFIETLIHIDYLREFDSEQLQYNEVFNKTDKRIRLLLPKQMRTNILQMIGDN